MEEFFSALDQYMAQNGKGTNYLAKKMLDIFEGDQSPFDVERGPLNTLSTKILELGETLANASDSLQSLALVSNTISDFEYKIKKIVLPDFSLFQKVIDSVQPATPTAAPKTTASSAVAAVALESIDANTKSTNVHIERASILIEKSNKYLLDLVRFFMPTSTTADRQHKKMRDKRADNFFEQMTAINKKANRESVIREPSPSPPRKGILARTTNIFSTQNNVGEAKSSFLGSLLKWGAILLSLPFIYDFVNKSPLGEVLTSAAGKLFNNITEWLGTNIFTIDNAKNIGLSIGGLFKKLFDNIYNDFDSGNYGTVAIKVALVLFAANLTGLTGTIISAGKLLVSGMGALSSQLVVVTVALVAMGYAVNKIKEAWEKWKHFQDTTKKAQDSSTFLAKQTRAIVEEERKVVDPQLLDLRMKSTTQPLSTEEKIRLQFLETQSRITSQLEKQTKLLQYRDTLSLLKDGVEYNRTTDKIDQSSVQIEKDLGVRDQLVIEGRKIGIDLWKYIDIKPAVKVTPVQDGEIVVPDKKDAHIFAKGGGPFDKTIKQMNDRIQEMSDILVEGFSTLVHTSATGSMQVVQSVLATAPAPPVAPSNFGGRDPIREFRNRVDRQLNFGH